MSTPLYSLSKDLATINDEIINADGEISADLEKRLDAVNLQLTEKATGLRKWMAIIEGDGGILDDEIKRLQRIKKQNENLHERLKAYIKLNMEVADLKKIETPIGTFTIAKNPASVEVVSEEMIPETFKDEIPAHMEINTKHIKEALDEGYDVPGAKLITNKTHLRIK